MIKIPVNIIKEKIVQATGMSVQELDSKIKLKLDQLSGLISEEGAAHIIANENNVKLFDSENTKPKIKELYAGMRNIEVTGKVTQMYELREFNTNGRQGKVASFLMGDETGMTRVTCWGDSANNVPKLKENDVVKVTNGFAKENNGRIEVHLNDNSKFVVNPDGETIGEIKKGGASSSKTRKSINDLNTGEENIELLATIVQSYDPNFWEVCPSCNKKVKNDDGEKICNEHGKVTPDFSYVMNCFLDDGSDSIRTVFFKNQMQNLTGRTHEQIVEMRETGFEDLKNDLLGKIISVVGRVTENEMFARKEFVAQFVEANPDPKAEIAKLEESPKLASVAQPSSNVEPIVENIVKEDSSEVVEKESESLVEEAPDFVEEQDEPIKPVEESISASNDDELLSLEDLEEIEDDEDIYS